VAVPSASSPRKLSRRDFLGLTSAAVGLWIPGAWAAAAVDAPSSESEYAPLLQVPAVAKNGAKVPIVVQMTHPMNPDHYVTSVQVMNRRDPIPSKGTFHFTPANGQVYLSFQARMHHGASEVSVTAACNRHGTWSTSRAITVPEDAGG
jgi:sulfur-oxidizing protein SoxY